MILKSLISEITLGEDSSRQFKIDVRNADSLVSEMAAFANSEGGTIFVGVADTGVLSGIGGVFLENGQEVPKFLINELLESKRMLAKNLKKILQDNEQMGLAKGEQIGITKGARRMLQNILIARFKLKVLPDWAVKVLNEASLSQIEAWGVKETDGKH